MKTSYNRILSFALASLSRLHASSPCEERQHTKQSIIGLQGKVVRYLVNPFGEVDALFLDKYADKNATAYVWRCAALVKPGDATACYEWHKP